jgi:hypothetical protein
MSDETVPVPVEAARAEILAQARNARSEYERAHQAWLAPYASADTARERHEAYGRWLGLWRAVEVIDALTGASDPDASLLHPSALASPDPGGQP